MKIGLISDTHSYIHDDILQHFSDCDEIWHAGDVGTVEVLDALETVAPVRAVWGNIDYGVVKSMCPGNIEWTCQGVKVWMIHIGGYPGRYPRNIKEMLQEKKPDLFICGHSHILKVIRDKELNLLHINPGAAGHHGFHSMRTIIRLDFIEGKMKNLEVIELGRRGIVDDPSQLKVKFD